MPRWPATKTRLPFRSNGVLAIGRLVPGNVQVACHHLLDEVCEARLRFPAELLLRLAGIANQKIDFGGAEILGIDANDGLAGFPVDAGFLDALAAPLDGTIDFLERQFDEFAHRTRLARGQHEVARLIYLKNPVHPDDVILGMTPVALGIEVTEIERLFEAGLDAGNRAGDLAGDEGLAPDRALMVEQDTVRSKHAVGLAVIHRDPVAVEFRDRIGRAWIERRGLLLRNFLHQTVEFRGRSLVETRLFLHAEDADRLEETKHADRVRVRGIFRALERDGHVALGREIVDFGRPDLLYQADQVGRIRHVAVVHQKRYVPGVRILIEVIDAGGIEGGRSPLDAMHGVAEAEQIFGKISAVLPGHARDQRNALFRVLNRHSTS